MPAASEIIIPLRSKLCFMSKAETWAVFLQLVSMIYIIMETILS